MNDDVEVPAVLYHYTSNNAFLSILKSRELRLSALSQSNDSLEGKWLLHALKSECREQGINQDHRQQIADFAEYVFKWVMGYGFCLSSDRDQLSQWRGYADDGRGVAIGFKTNELLKLTNFASVSRGKTELKKVLYEVEEHRLHVAPIVKKLFEASRNLPLDDSLRLAFGADQDSVEKDHPVASI